MKYMIEYSIRVVGLTHEQNLGNQEALLNTFSKWEPEEGLTVHAFVSTLANGGYVLVEADDPNTVSLFVNKFVYRNDVVVVPVVDVADGVGTGNAALAWTKAATGG